MKLLLNIKVYIAAIILTSTLACKKECDSTYTITGKVTDATNDTPYSDMLFVLRVSEKKNFGGTNSALLSKGFTNSKGEFTTTYDCTDIDGDIQFLLGNHEARLPINQNITDKTIYFSPEGSFDVYVKLKAPILPDDTLFISTAASFELNDVKIDTFINPKEGFFRNIRTPNKSYTIFWGRSSNAGAGKFKFNPQKNTFGAGTPNMGISVSGDPYIDKLELEF